MTTHYLGKPVSWKLYPDLILPHEAAINMQLPINIQRIREHEAFVQSQQESFNSKGRSAVIAREAIDSMLVLTMGERSARARISARENND